MQDKEIKLLNEEVKRATIYAKNTQKVFIKLIKAWQKVSVDDSGRLCGKAETDKQER